MKIVNVAYPLAAVSADTAGGSEQVLWMLDNALVRQGHKSIVIAAEGSSVSGKLVATLPVPPLIDAAARERAQACVREAILRVLDEERPHLLHFHGLDFHTYLPKTQVPVLVTLHLPFAWYDPAALQARVIFNCVSESQHRNRLAGVEVAGWIENGVPVDRLYASFSKREYAITIGRVCKEKAPHLAMEAAARAGTFLMVGGQLFGYEDHRRYFDSHVKPRLRASQNRFLGALSFERKRRLIAGATSFVQPTQAEETSSLTAMESLACGTPVVSFGRGALPQIVENGRTGFVVNDTTAMACAIRDSKSLSPEECRRAARERFDARRMTSEYFQLYRGLIGKSAVVVRGETFESRWRELWASSPATTPFQSPEWLIPWMEHLGGGDAELRPFSRAGKMVGLLPMERWEGKLRLLGEGVSDYLDAIGEVELPGEPFEFTSIPSWSPLWREGLATASEPCLVTRLPQTWDAYLASLGPQLRKDLRLVQQTGRRMDPEQIQELFDVHGKRWQDKGEAGVLADPRIQAFHRDVARRFHKAGMLRLWGAYEGSRCAGVAYCFIWGGRLYFYLGGFDPSCATMSPGSLSLGASVRSAMDGGAQALDFLRGSEPYKRRWRAVEKPTYRLSG